MDDLQHLWPDGRMKPIVLGNGSLFEGDDLTHSFHRFLPGLVTLASPSRRYQEICPFARAVARSAHITIKASIEG
jgi:hypothetical protein